MSESALERTFTTPELSSLARGLVNAGLVAEDTIRQLLLTKDEQRSLIRALVEGRLIDEIALCHFLSERYGVEELDLNGLTFDPSVVALLPSRAARRYLALPIREEASSMMVAMVDPTDVVAKDDLKTILRRDLHLVVVTYSQLLATIERSQLNLKEQFDLSEQAEERKEAVKADVADVVEDGPIVSLVNQMISQAVLDRASDIHVEPINGAIRIRFRIDGVLHEVGRLNVNVHAKLMTRIKILAGLDISERRRPQDGRFSVGIEGQKVDLRVATLPTYLGEKVVIRVLDTGTARLDLEDLGFLPDVRRLYDRLTDQPWGTILITGPTGSGKSTTLYATLNRLNRVETNIITVEDPVEYQLSGVAQMQVNPAAGVTFSSALRSILRADPDIILVGEVRDRETAEIAIESALTGHLVLTSLHTNDALSTPTRLFEMGVEPYLVASALTAVVGQRLARRLCLNCRVPSSITRDELREVGFAAPATEEAFHLYRADPKGCERCSRTGYYGRVALHELLEITEPLGRAIAARAPMEELHRIAAAQGFITLRQAGLVQVLQGVTSIEEILRVLI
ncbi:ATPase, T2SS/T4P/T4SS family [Ferrimicrobium sp.]|uniref:GspE/PulE family protein n=1 Tax=Ferrimicrobium sp. TaxID=2926050 RepID=UPI00260E52CC|nr:ATPase, T2SS/T4P/T4SS family [Ferrimicrobium sp.]